MTQDPSLRAEPLDEGESVGSRRLIKFWLIFDATFATRSYAYGVLDDDSFGNLSLRSERKSHVWTFSNTNIIDGHVVTSPPDEVVYDRRLENKTSVGAEGFSSNRFGIRFNATVEGYRRRIAGQEVGGPINDRTSVHLEPSLDFTFVTDKGLEVILGILSDIYRKDKEVDDTSAGQSTTTRSAAKVLGKRMGVLRRAGKWNGGFGYTQGGNSTRSDHTVVFDGSTNDVVETIFMPSRIDVFANGSNGASSFRFDLGFIQARGLGPKDSRGATIYTDHFEAVIAAGLSLGGAASLETSLGHRTFSYGSSAFVTMDTIPVTTLGLRLYSGQPSQGAFVGVTGSTAKDGQSLPEFNAKYQVVGYGVTVGFCTPF